MDKSYNAKETEARWYAFWEEGHFFRADAHSTKPPYTLVIPPPNVTGILHMGHALVNTLQDVLIRWKRMSGYEALWLPGTDHAGIATQTVVERHLLKTTGKRRKEYDRETFVGLVWEWKEKSEKTILQQLKRLGASCDWSRLSFTMDETRSRAVRTCFKRLFDKGVIYRGHYLVNWDPVTQTALADDEVEYEERPGHLWYFRYPLADHSGFLSVATTRPETMLGDTALAVSPHDPRYQKWIGKRATLPLLDRELPIIADYQVDPDFGTGVVKVTPAHDPNDYRMALDHGLEKINILTPEGFINEAGGPFAGLSREEARKAVVAEMERKGLLVKVEPYSLRVGLSYRSKAVIEPYLSTQWFLKMTPFVGVLEKAVEEGDFTLFPKQWEATYFHWVKNLRDWCISRQLWWGHRIPVWYRKGDPSTLICYAGEGLPPEVEQEPDLWEQDPDVLDTWFSSALWPLSTLGWPEQTADFQKFYPIQTLVTGHDILFFWVARMLCMGKEATGRFPFPETFLHGLIYGKSYWQQNDHGEIHYITGSEKREYDLGKPVPKEVQTKWEKLSKSKGNVIDPLEMCEEYGTDAVRMALCACANQSPQIDLDRRRFEEYQHFANKVWNGARFVWINLEGLTSEAFSQGIDRALLSFEDRWILSALNQVNQKIHTALSSYQFDQAAAAAYHFFWNLFCAYYVEFVKPVLFGKRGSPAEREQKQKLLLLLLLNSIRLLHPMAPFITEALFQQLKERFKGVSHQAKDPYTRAAVEALLAPACIVAPYPTLLSAEDILPEVDQKFLTLEALIRAVRRLRSEMKIAPESTITLYLTGEGLEGVEPLLELSVKADKLVRGTPPPSTPSATCTVEGYTIVVPIPEAQLQVERTRLQKECAKSETLLTTLRERLSNHDFLQQADPLLVEKQKTKLRETEEAYALLKEKLARI